MSATAARLIASLLVLAGCAEDPRGATAPRDAGSHAGTRIDAGPLGLVGDVVATADGRLFAVDFGEKRLAVLSAAGAPPQLLGRAGHGPGEFVDPVALSAAPGGIVYLLDRGTQRLEVYRTGAGAVTRIGSLTLDFAPEDVCTLGDRVFVLGARDGHVVHEVSRRDGRVLRSRVAEPASRDPMLSAFHGAGFLACGPGETLTLLPLLRPEISRYSATTGRRLGIVRIPGYRQTRVRSAGGSVIYEAPAGGAADYAASLVPLGDGRMLAQVGPVQRGATPYEFTSLRSFVLSRDGTALAELASTLPRIPAMRGDRAVGVHTDPAPALSLVSLPLDPASRTDGDDRAPGAQARMTTQHREEP